MKGIFLLPAMLVSYHLSAQARLPSAMAAPTYFFAEAAPGLGPQFHFNASLNLVCFNHHEVSVGYNSFWRRSPATPSDFRPSTFLNFSLFPYPTEFLTGTAITYGYVFYRRRKDITLIRFSTRTGVLIGNYSEPADFIYTPGSLAIIMITAEKIARLWRSYLNPAWNIHLPRALV